MDNSFFIYSENNLNQVIERFHICTWEFIDNTALIEFGCEIIPPKKITKESISLSIYIPWLSDNCVVKDLYNNLKESENSRFIFNDAVTGNVFLDDGQQKHGVVQNFIGRPPLCIVPINTVTNSEKKIITININLKHFLKRNISNDTNIYFRFYLNPKIQKISTRKLGINRSTIIYDIKVNEKRNLPENSATEIKREELCKIKKCFCINIIPNDYDLTFFDASSLKNIRTLEIEAFNRYLKDKRVKKDEMVVVFNKKENKDGYGFFSVFAKERIGAGQFALAVLVNLLGGVLLFIPLFRKENNYSILSTDFWKDLPIEVYIAIFIGLTVFFYFIWPGLKKIFRSLFTR